MPMATCGVCGKNSIFPETYGSLTLCKKCSMKILTPTWKDAVYSTNDELMEQRDSVLKMARRAGFPQHAVDALAKYFNDQKIKGLIKIFAGGAGQNLVVFEDRFSIDTQEDFDDEEVGEAYRALMTPSLRGKGVKEPEEDSGIDGEMLAGVARDVLSGFAFGGGLGRSVVRAGVGVATGMAAKSQKGDAPRAVANVELRVSQGMRTYKYSDFQDVRLRTPVGEEEYGFLEFQKGVDPDPAKDIYFFFKRGDSRKKGAKELHGYIQGRVIQIATQKVEREREAREAAKAKARAAREAKDALIAQALQSSRQSTQMSAPDELMKWKQLLDVGAISQQEYDAKKAQLLGL